MCRRMPLWADWLDDGGSGCSFCTFCVFFGFYYGRRNGRGLNSAKIDEAFDGTIPGSFEPGLMAMEQLQSVGIIGEAPISQRAADGFVGLLIGFGELLGLVVHLRRHLAEAISSTMECS